MLSSVTLSLSNLNDQVLDISFISRAFSGQLDTHAKHAMHFFLSASPDSASMAPVGHNPTQSKHMPHFLNLVLRCQKVFPVIVIRSHLSHQ